MKGLSKRETARWKDSRLDGHKKKPFTQPHSRSTTTHTGTKIVRFANGVQLTLTSNNRV